MAHILGKRFVLQGVCVGVTLRELVRRALRDTRDGLSAMAEAGIKLWLMTLAHLDCQNDDQQQQFSITKVLGHTSICNRWINESIYATSCVSEVALVGAWNWRGGGIQAINA